MKRLFFIFFIFFTLNCKAQAISISEIMDIPHIAAAKANESMAKNVKKQHDSITNEVKKWDLFLFYFMKTTGKVCFGFNLSIIRPTIAYTTISSNFFQYEYPKELSTVWQAFRHPIKTVVGNTKRKALLKFLGENYDLAQAFLMILLEKNKTITFGPHKIKTTKTNSNDEILVDDMQLYTGHQIYEKICQTTKLYSSLIRRE